MDRLSRHTLSKAGMGLGLILAIASSAAAAHAQAYVPPLALVGVGAPDGERVFVYSHSFGECVQEYVCSSTSCWQHNCIQGVQDYPAQGSRMLTFYEPNAGRIHLFFVSGDQHIHDWSWPDTRGLASNVTDVDVTQQASAPLAQGIYVSGFAGGALMDVSTLTGYVDGSGIYHVFYDDVTQTIRELYHYSGGWSTGHVAAGGGAGGPSAGMNGRGLTSLWDGRCQHIFYSAGGGDLWEDYACGSWQGHRLSGSGGAISPNITTAKAPQAYMSTAYSAGAEYVWGPAEDGSGLEVAYCATGSCWGSTEFNLISAPYVTPNSPTITVGPNPIYVGEASRFVYSPNVTRVALNVSYGNPEVFLTGSGIPGSDEPNGSVLSEITGFVDASGTSHIFEIGTNSSGYGDLYEFYQTSTQTSWSTNQLSHGANFQ